MSKTVEKLYGFGADMLFRVKEKNGEEDQEGIPVGCCCLFVGLSSNIATGQGLLSTGVFSGPIFLGYQDNQTYFLTRTDVGSFNEDSQTQTCLCTDTYQRIGTSSRTYTHTGVIFDPSFRATYYSYPTYTNRTASRTTTVCDCGNCTTTTDTNTFYSGSVIVSNTKKESKINYSDSSSGTCPDGTTTTNFINRTLDASTTLSDQVQRETAHEWALENFNSDNEFPIEEQDFIYYKYGGSGIYFNARGINFASLSTPVSYRYSGTSKYRIAYSTSPTGCLRVTLTRTVKYTKRDSSGTETVTTDTKDVKLTFNTPSWDDDTKCGSLSENRKPDDDSLFYSDVFNVSSLLEDYPIVSDTHLLVEVEAEIRITKVEILKKDDNDPPP